MLTFGEDGYSQVIDIGAGTIKVKADGSYSFTADNATTGSVPVNATYTVRDGDGDTATASIAFQVTDANTPTGGIAAATVDDDGLTGGNAASTTGDINANAGEVPLNASEAIYTGTLGGSVGLDTPGVFSFAALDGTSGTVGTETVIYSWAANILTATGPRGVLFTVEVTNPATGAYTVTLRDNVLHATGPNDENAPDPTTSLAYTITDADSSVANGTLTVTFDDDAPTASAEASQNVAEGATVAGTLDFVAGADGASVTHVNGALLTFGEDGYSQAINLGSGFLKVKADGSYSFTANNPTVSPVAPINATYTVRDADGDTATASIAFQVIDANTPTGGTAAATVDDDGLTGGNPASTTGDINANAGEVPLNASEAIYTGTLGGSVGLDGAGANGFKFAASLNGQTGVTVGTETVTYSVVGNVLTATVDSGTRSGTPLFKVEITDQATGAYKVTLLDNVLHAGGPNDEATDAAVSLGYLITDADGSSAPGTLTVTFDDDAPTAVSDLAQASPNQVGAKFDMLLIVDTSGSMDGTVSGVPSTFGFGNTRIALARVALLDLINQSNVDEVKIVKFGSDATSTVWMSKANAIAYVLNGANFTTGGATDYDAALRVAKEAFLTAPSTADPRLVNFLSDGEPTEGDTTGTTGILESDTNNSGFGGLGEESHWINFLAANNVVRSSAFGFGGLNATNANNLEPIAWQSPELAGTNTTAAQDGNVLIVNDTNIALLGSVLQSTVPGTASGNVLTDGIDDAFGADGGRILSIEINGTVYTWNGLTDAAARIDPGTPGVAGDDLVATSLTNILTPEGGRLTFNFLTGVWGYTTPANVNPSMPDEVFTYKLIDGDGDVSSATLTVDLVPIPSTPQIFTPPGGLIPFWTTDTTDAAQTFINRVSFFDGDNPASVRVAIASPNGGDAFSAASGSGVIVSGSGTSVITLDGTIADINAFLAGNHVAWNPVGAGIPSNQVDRTLSISIDDNGIDPGGNIASKSLILDHKTATFSGNGDTANFAGWNLNEGAATLINAGNGNDTVVTSWSHGPATQDVHYEGGGGTDTITLVFTPAQLAEILSGAAASTLDTYLDGTIDTNLNLGNTSWNAQVSGFENATLAIAAGFSDFVVYSAIGATDANLPDIDSLPDNDAVGDTVVGSAAGETLSGGIAASDTAANGNDILVALAGNDIVWGGGGSDLLLGGDGDDHLHGGIGIDILSGGRGADTFYFSSTDPGGGSLPTTNADYVVDYSFLEGDTLDLSALLDAAFSPDDQVSDFVRLQQSGANVNVLVDVNGGGDSFVTAAVLAGYGTLGTSDPVSVMLEAAQRQTITG